MSNAKILEADFEADCCHVACSIALRESVESGFAPEPNLCIEVERAEDERWFAMDADYDRRFPR